MRDQMLIAVLAVACVTVVGQAKQRGDTGFVHEKADQLFVEAAVADGVAEVALSMLAERQASDARVKSFAQRILAAHTATNEQLKTLAAARDISVPTTLDANRQAEHERLTALSGAAFDRAYMDAMARLHDVGVELFEHESGLGLDAGIRSWAARTLPSVREHLQESRTLR